MLGSLSLVAQAPPDWQTNKILGADLAPGTTWYSAGQWMAGAQGKGGMFVNSLGLGNSIQGAGITLSAGHRAKNWSIAGQFLAGCNQNANSFGKFYRGHAIYQTQNGWNLGLEKEPLVWGYGLNGGYLLGEAAQPFPRMRIETPCKSLSVFGVPLGNWSAQTFMGQLENDRVTSELVQDPLYRQRIIKQNGDPKSPLFNGYRLQATFGDSLEFYINYTNLWGGNLNGKSIMKGYQSKDYLTAMFGLKDTLAEANMDPTKPTPGPYRNKGRSASNFDTGARLRVRALESLFNLDHAFLYISRGAKNIWWTPGTFIKSPLSSLGKDIKKNLQLLSQGRMSLLFKDYNVWRSAPNIVQPDDTVGLIFGWDKFRLGIEYSDIVNVGPEGGTQQSRPFVTDLYPTGFYRYGDPLGNAIAGEHRVTTLKIELHPNKTLSLQTWVHHGKRPYKENKQLWNESNPGKNPTNNMFYMIQQVIRGTIGKQTAFQVGLAWQKQSAVDYIQGNTKSTLRWFGGIGFRSLN